MPADPSPPAGQRHASAPQAGPGAQEVSRGAQETGREAQEVSRGAQETGREAQEAGSEAPAVEERVRVETAAQMRALGTRLAALLRPGDLVVLSGPLGAGKTTLTQGIGAGLDVRGPVTSPTFVIARIHPALRDGPDLVHADAYRLGSRAEVDDLDLDTDLATSVTVVEWGEGLVEDLAASFLEVRITPVPAARAAPGDGDGDEARTVAIVGWGSRWHAAAAAARLALSRSPVIP